MIPPQNNIFNPSRSVDQEKTLRVVPRSTIVDWGQGHWPSHLNPTLLTRSLMLSTTKHAQS